MTTETITATDIYLVRYGAVPEVARFANHSPETPMRGTRVVVETDRGIQIGATLERLKSNFDPQKEQPTEFKLLRSATTRDLESASDRIRECDEAFPQWCARIAQWGLNLELVELEWTLDREKLILYVPLRSRPRLHKVGASSRRDRSRYYRSPTRLGNRSGDNPDIVVWERRRWVRLRTLINANKCSSDEDCQMLEASKPGKTTQQRSVETWPIADATTGSTAPEGTEHAKINFEGS